MAWTELLMAPGVRRGPRSERGAVAVEFALGSVLFLTILFGVIAFGSTYSRIEVFQSAAREGARVAAVGGNAQAAIDAVDSAALPYVRAGSSPTVTVNGVSYSGSSKPCSTGASGSLGNPVAVQWTQPFELDFIFFELTNNQTFRGVFRCEA